MPEVEARPWRPLGRRERACAQLAQRGQVLVSDENGGARARSLAAQPLDRHTYPRTQATSVRDECGEPVG